MRRKLHTTFAAIHLGSEKISMQITEYKGMNRYKVIDFCQRPLRLGEETFKNDIVPIDLINEICEILIGFKRLMDEYGVEEYSLQATTAVREAHNQLFLLDQIYSRTGLKVEIVNMPREIYTKYVAIRNTLKEAKITSHDGALLMMDISSGDMGITLVENDKIRYQSNMHVGIIRIKESFDRNKRESLKFNMALTQFMESAISPVREELQNQKARYLVLSGTETDLLLHIMQQDMGGKIHRIKADAFHSFFDKVQKLNLPQIMSVYHIPENDAELVLPMVIFYERLLDVLPVEEIIVTEDRFIDGMELLHIGGATNSEQAKAWEKELVSLFHMIGKRYKYDKKHVSQVERLSLIIFDKIANRYGMGDHERLLLQGTAIIHDLGKYVNLRSHSIFTYQLIMATDILGFSERDKQIMAMTSYYHANAMFENLKPNAPRPNREDTALIAKLAAIIRLADAMDRSYCQKIKSCVPYLREQNLVLQIQSKMDVSLEMWTFDRKSEFFEEVFGLKPVLERVN